MADVKIVIGGDAAGAAAAAKTAEASLQRMGAAGQVSAGQTANAMRMLPAQLTDVVTQLQGGASPLTVLIQQGGQVKDMFGGFGPMFTALASAISPVMVAAGAVAAGVGAVALALYQGHAQSETFNRSLILTGNYAGATAGQMDLMADSVSQGAQVTIGAAREITAAAVATGAFGPQSIGAVSQAMAALQHASGATTQDVVSDFASMSKGVAAWTAEHNRQYNFLTAAQWEYIRTLERQGQKEAAMVEASKLLEQSLAGRRQDLGYLEGMWRDVADAASKAWDAMLGWGRSDDSSKTADLVKSMKAAQERLAEAQSDPARWKMLGGSDEEVAKLQAELDDLRDRYVRVTTEAAQKAKAQAAEQTKIDDARSGRTAAAGNARVDRDLANEAWATQAWLAEIDLRQKAEDAAHQLGLSSLAQYEQQRIALIQMERDARIASLSEQIRLEKSRPVKGDTPKEVEAQQLQSEVRVTQLRAQITAAMDAAARDVATAQAAIAADAVQTARDRAQQWADEWLKADARVKQLAQDTLTARTALIQDPNARAQAEAAQQIEQLKRQRDQDLVPAQRALSLAPNEEAAAELQRRIDEVMGAYADRIGAVHDTLADRLKPGWQKLIDGWQNTNAVMRDGYATMIDGVVKDGEAGFVQLMTTGRMDTHTLVNDIMAEFARMQYRKLVASVANGSLWTSLLGLLGGAADGGGINTGVGPAKGDTLLSGWRAEGGTVLPGGLYQVGERGPELLRMGSTGGTVIPNRALTQQAGAAPGPAVQLTLPTTIQIDARSDQAQVAQLVGGAMAQTEKRMWDQLRMRGVVR